MEETLRKISEEEYYDWLDENPDVQVFFQSYYKGEAQYSNPDIEAARSQLDMDSAFYMHIKRVEPLDDGFTFVQNNTEGWVYEAEPRY